MIALAACATTSTTTTDTYAREPPTTRTVVSERWFAVPTRCGQGPYEIEMATLGGRWQEQLALVVQSPKRLKLTAALSLDEHEVLRQTGPDSAADNHRCLADPRELAQAPRTSASASSAPGEGSTFALAPDRPPSGPDVRARVALTPAAVPAGQDKQLLDMVWGSATAPSAPRPVGARLRITLWSTLPNDFEGAVFGVRQILRRPAMSDAEFEVWVQAREQRQRDEEARRQAARTPDVIATEREQDERKARAAAAQRERENRELAAHVAQAEQRKAYCNAHPEDRDCWGPGGRGVKQELERLRGEREAYCAAHTEEARCWSEDEWARRRKVWNSDPAEVAVPDPTGPPPPAIAEVIPPSPSTHAEWRPGYFRWTGGDWIWIGGMWRVPDEDIRTDQTTRAPIAPPAPRAESVPSARAAVIAWTPGYWQWSGRGWVWVPGSWQLPPSPTLVWRPAHWVGRSGVFVFVPGAWVSAGRP